MLHVRLTNIVYDIQPEDIELDVDFDPEDFEGEEDYKAALLEEIQARKTDLPTEITIEIDEEDIPPELEDEDYDEFISQIDVEASEWLEQEIPYQVDTFCISNYYYD